MVRQILAASGLVILISSCTAIKSLNFTNNRQVITATSVPKTTNQPAKFIDEITVTPVVTTEKPEVKPGPTAFVASGDVAAIDKPSVKTEIKTNPSAVEKVRVPEVESASAVQFKYAVLMNTEVEALPSTTLLASVDDWYGVRYRMGGTTKRGVDCSGFSSAVYLAAYGYVLPRVSREQYRVSRKISTTELKEGDLVFFNTRGRGVSHVGVYLGNNKFVHASVSQGVVVSDLFETYYLQRFVGAGRIDDKQLAVSSN